MDDRRPWWPGGVIIGVLALLFLAYQMRERHIRYRAYRDAAAQVRSLP